MRNIIIGITAFCCAFSFLSPASAKPDISRFREITLPDGSEYEGELKGGAPHGSGIKVMTDGSRYEGEFKDGVPQGYGILTRPDGTGWEGEFSGLAGEVWGKGVYIEKDGTKWIGEFYQGHPAHAGKGIFLYKDGRMEKGYLRGVSLTNR